MLTSDNFMNLIAQEEQVFTENGMAGYKTTSNPLVDMNFKMASYRSMSEGDIIADFKKVLASPYANYFMKFLCFCRNPRGGLGERRTFRICLKYLASIGFFRDDDLSGKILDLCVMYGRWDDLLVLLDYDCTRSRVIDLIDETLKHDVHRYSINEPCTLLAKWLPSPNASSKNTKRLARIVYKGLGITEKKYRQLLATLREYIQVVETYACANRWNEIDYNRVPSLANLKYENAFFYHDSERRNEYLRLLKEGNKTVHMNGQVNFPHDIVHKYNIHWYRDDVSINDSLEVLWKNLPQNDLTNTIVVRDGSGSMGCPIGNSHTTALDVSTALAIYCSERLQGGFANKFITFSSDAELVDLSDCISLRDKLKECARYDDCSNTNLDNVFKLILKTAKHNHLAQEEIPAQILIISDMEFDQGVDSHHDNVIECWQERFANEGYELPKLVFWNVNSKTCAVPCRDNGKGVILVSGFSPSVLQLVNSGELDPWKALKSVLDSQVYQYAPFIEGIQNKLL